MASLLDSLPPAPRGGKRSGAGRKAETPGDPMRPVVIKMNAADREKLKALGGAAWVREKIRKAKVKL